MDRRLQLLNIDFYNHIVSQLIDIEFDIKLLDKRIVLRANNQIYEEDWFNSYDKFTDEDITSLENISKNADHLNKIPDNIPFLKLWYMVTHEKYIVEDVKYDKYGRVGVSNLIKPFEEILKIPVADVIRLKLNEILKLEKVIHKNIYLTCDFDHLNIWDVWGLKDFLREVFLCMKNLHFKKLYKTVASYFFSRFSESANGYLNMNMYQFNNGFINIGFFIASCENYKYDGNINYKNKVVRNFIQKLRNKGVLIGLHTNFNTYSTPENIFKQEADFKVLFSEPVVLNRHHYLRFIFPNYLQVLEKIGVKTDFSIYFPESTIFRCGTSSRFVPWNETNVRPFNVSIIPTTIMDGTFSDYLFCSYETAMQLSIQKLNLANKFGTDIVLLWHNRSTYKYSNIKNNYHPKLVSDLIGHIKKNIIDT